ncbi:MAG: DNA-3-methyladenine glycosylase I [Acidimicrobiia bacterium]
MRLLVGDDALARCEWGAEPEIYRVYHDHEWGRATTDDIALFEKVCLEGFQAGLSWLTILRKRESFRAGFSGFDPELVATFDERDVVRLMGDEGIVRHEGKIRSAINNAQKALDLIDEKGSLAAYFWSWAPMGRSTRDDIPSVTPESTALSKDLKLRGWSFVGPTTIYAFMQAMGMVNDHLEGCHVTGTCEDTRQTVLSEL